MASAVRAYVCSLQRGLEGEGKLLLFNGGARIRVAINSAG